MAKCNNLRSWVLKGVILEELKYCLSWPKCTKIKRFQR